MPHDPEVDDAPVGTWEALKDSPSVYAVAVDHIGVGSRYGKGPGAEIGRFRREFSGGPGGWAFAGRLHKGAPLRSQTGPSMHDLDSGSVAANGAPSRFLIGEASEPAHLGCGMRGNGSMKRPVWPQNRQRSHNAGWLSCQDCDAGGCSTASAIPPSNDAGETIEREP